MNWSYGPILSKSKACYTNVSHCNEEFYPNILTMLQRPVGLQLPVGSSSCAHAFSPLRRLKTWLRTSMANVSPVPEPSFLPAPYRGWTRAGEMRVQDNLHAHAQNAAIFPPKSGDRGENHMLFAGWEVRIVKNCDLGDFFLLKIVWWEKHRITRHYSAELQTTTQL